MSTEFEFDVFLSHSSKDKPVVRAMAERLRAAGLRVWFDEWQIQLGDSIFSKIEHGLEKSRQLLLCMSANAFDSDWTTLEGQTVRFRDPLNRERRFIPLKLDDTPVKGTLAQFLYLDWRTPSDAAFQRLLDACKAAMPVTPSPVGATALATAPDLAAFASAWQDATPALANRLRLSFIDAAGEPLSRAKCGAKAHDCDDCILRLQTDVTGVAVLLYQCADGSFLQLLPTPDGCKLLAAGVHDYPGSLLAIPQTGTPAALTRMHFTQAGTETALAFLMPAIPAAVEAREALAKVDGERVRALLQALLAAPEMLLAVASVRVVQV